MNIHQAQTKSSSGPGIDRRAVVDRHRVVLTRPDTCAPLSVGNGEFAFTADITGLQTFPADYATHTPLCTLSQWGWHSTPPGPGIDPSTIRATEYDTDGRPVPYVTDREGQEGVFDWLRRNPHRLHLGRVALVLRHRDGRDAVLDDLDGVRQELDLWTGILTSVFRFDGVPVRVETCCAGGLDTLAVRVTSPLCRQARLAIEVSFPYASHEMDAADWSRPGDHTSVLHINGPHRGRIERTLDGTRYTVDLRWETAGVEQVEPHWFRWTAAGDRIDWAGAFSPDDQRVDPPAVAEAQGQSAAFWENFWTDGGAIDLAGSTDARAEELERRVVLSQYLTRVNCAGSQPPQESGLVCNTWYGKPHLEMHWWHGVHFALWGRLPLLARSLGWYHDVLPQARAIAQQQGYAGARWPKMVGPDGTDSPSPVAPLLLWQQPHPIYYAELCYREAPTQATLTRWRAIVEESGAFMADFVKRAPDGFVIGPPFKAVQENNDPLTSRNPAFELVYWRFGLSTAQRWRERLGLPRHGYWDEVLQGLRPPPHDDGRYLLQDDLTDTYTEWNWEHPAIVGLRGVLPGNGVDPAVHRRTVEAVMQCWQFDRCWGWDFPMLAMAAATAGRPDLAIDALFLDSPKNTYGPNGHNYQRPNLPVYLPGNGGLLAAVALMAAGSGHADDPDSPGFPGTGWKVRYEGLQAPL